MTLTLLDNNKLKEIVEKMNLDTCLRFIKQYEGGDTYLEVAQEVVIEMVEILIDINAYPNGISDFIKEVKANDFTMTRKKEIKSMWKTAFKECLTHEKKG